MYMKLDIDLIKLRIPYLMEHFEREDLPKVRSEVLLPRLIKEAELYIECLNRMNTSEASKIKEDLVHCLLRYEGSEIRKELIEDELIIICDSSLLI